MLSNESNNVPQQATETLSPVKLFFFTTFPLGLLLAARTCYELMTKDTSYAYIAYYAVLGVVLVLTLVAGLYVIMGSGFNKDTEEQMNRKIGLLFLILTDVMLVESIFRK